MREVSRQFLFRSDPLDPLTSPAIARAGLGRRGEVGAQFIRRRAAMPPGAFRPVDDLAQPADRVLILFIAEPSEIRSTVVLEKPGLSGC